MQVGLFDHVIILLVIRVKNGGEGSGGVQVSGTVDGVFQLGSEGQHRKKCLIEAQAAAHAKVVKAGADPSTCKVVPPVPFHFYCAALWYWPLAIKLCLSFPLAFAFLPFALPLLLPASRLPSGLPVNP